jgi:hypothetical protein
MKKSLSIFALLILFSIAFVTAQSGGPVEGFGKLLGGAGDIIVTAIQTITDLIFNLNQIDEFLFAKIIILIITFIVTYSVLRKSEMLGDHKGMQRLIAAAVSILAVRFIPDNEFMVGILLPYGTLGAALTIFLPFFVYFFFVYNSITGSMFRKVAWFIFGSVFVGLWWMRSDEISSIVGTMYGIVIVLVLLAVLFDKQFKSWWGLREVNRFLTGVGNVRTVQLQKEYIEIANVNTPNAARRRRQIENELRRHGVGLP